VPFDTRVWKEACALQKRVRSKRAIAAGKGYTKGFEILESVHVYRHPMPNEGSSGALGYLLEYSCALFWGFFIHGGFFLRRGFHVIQGCNPPDNIVLVALMFKSLE